MIIVLEPNLENLDEVLARVLQTTRALQGITAQTYSFEGSRHSFTEVHLVGSTREVSTEVFAEIPGVLRVVRVSTKYRRIGRHGSHGDEVGFHYNGVEFGDDEVHVLAGLCAVDTREHVDQMMGALHKEGIVTTRMGAYKPRTSPYDFQGLGRGCLPWVFELAGQHGIKVVAMEVTDSSHIEEIQAALEEAGKPTGVLLQVGTRNAQNFELLKNIGQQKEFPVLFKRGMGISLDESLNACEYIASEGNPNIVFCLRGVKSHLGDPHRNLVDFTHVPVLRRQTRLTVCIDPSHSVGTMAHAPDGVPDILHATGQGLIAGATMVLVDFHPDPPTALCDGPQALTLDKLRPYLDYVREVRKGYEGAAAAWKSQTETER